MSVARPGRTRSITVLRPLSFSDVGTLAASPLAGHNCLIDQDRFKKLNLV